MDDITLTFNPAAFLQGIQSIIGGIDQMNNKFDKFSQTSGKKTQKVTAGVGSMVKGMAVFSAVTGAVKKLMSHIPEIGKTFNIAGDIMMRNFLWPIRKLLIPYLQKLLDWVRDNRAMFVRWGTHVANIFRGIFSIVKQFIQILKGMWEKISAGIERVFGKTTKSMSDLINIAVFKITALATYIMMTLEPVFDFIANLFVTVLDAAKNFFQGLMSGIGDIMPEFDSLLNSLVRIAKALGIINEKGNTLNRIFKALGSIIGGVLGPFIRGLVQSVDLLAYTIEKLVVGAKMLAAWKSGDKLEMKKLKKESAQLNKEFKERAGERWGRQMDAWRQSDRDLREAWRGTPVPKGSVMKTSSKETTVIDKSKTDIKITVDGSKSPAATAEAVDRKLRDSLRESRYRSGGK